MARPICPAPITDGGRKIMVHAITKWGFGPYPDGSKLEGFDFDSVYIDCEKIDKELVKAEKKDG
jgi:hypothetical protein